MHSLNSTLVSRFDPHKDYESTAAADFVLNELMKVRAYLGLSEEDRGEVAVAVAHIGYTFYLEGYNRHRRCGQPAGHWFKGCWLGLE